MAFDIKICKGPRGLPILEVPDGPFILERLSPGDIREADFYENFRWSGGKLFACRRGKSKKGKCQESLRLLRIRHKKEGKDDLFRDCESGALSARRKKQIRQILRDVGLEEEARSLGQEGDQAFVGPLRAAKTDAGRWGQFILLTVFSTFVAGMIWFHVFPKIFKKTEEMKR